MSFKGGKKSNVYQSEEGYDLYAAEYDKKLEYLNSFEKDVVLRLLGDLSGMRVLDVGCGTGRLFKEVISRNGELVGTDVSAEMLKVAGQKYPSVETTVADIENLPFEDESFDVVLALLVVVHLKDLKSAFEEVFRVLRPGGFFIVSNINQRKAPKLKLSGKREIVINSHYHMPKKIVEKLKEEFFEIEKEEFVNEGSVWINQIVKAVK